MMTATNSTNNQTLTRASTLGRLLASLVTALLLMSGCDVPDRHDLKLFRKPAVWEVATPTANTTAEAREILVPAVYPHEQSAPHTDWKYWYLHHIDPDQITGGGVMQSQLLGSAGTGAEHVKITLSERTLVTFPPRRSSGSTDSSWQANPLVCLTSNEQTFWHAQDGRLLRAQCRVRLGPLETSKEADVMEDQVRLQSDYLTSTRKKQIPHQGDLGGPLTVYQSLLAQPLAPGELRESTVLLPIQETLAKLQLLGRRDALTKYMGADGLVVDSLHEAAALVSIDATTRRERYYWYDDDGVVQATNITGEKRFTYRCSEEQYLQLGDVFLQHRYPISLELAGNPIPAGEIKQLALEIELSPQPVEPAGEPESDSEADAEDAAPTARPRPGPAPRQYVQALDARRQRLITAQRPVAAEKLAGRFETYESSSSPADLAATAILNFKSPAVRKLLQISTSMSGMNNREKATELNRTVHSLLSFEPLSVGIRPASEIAQQSIADSTEHAILLIAMLRASNVPARMAIGIQHLSGPQSPATTHRFVYHAWVIAETDESWISLDPTTGKETGANCVALQIDDLSNLNAANFVEAYLGILQSLRMSVSGVVMQ